MKIQWSIPETDYDVDNRGSSALAHPFFLRSLRIQFFKCKSTGFPEGRAWQAAEATALDVEGF